MRFLITIQSHKKKNRSVIKILVSMQNGSCFFFFFFWNCHVKTTRLPFELNSKSYFSNRLLLFFFRFSCCLFVVIFARGVWRARVGVTAALAVTGERERPKSDFLRITGSRLSQSMSTTRRRWSCVLHTHAVYLQRKNNKQKNTKYKSQVQRSRGHYAYLMEI